MGKLWASRNLMRSEMYAGLINYLSFFPFLSFWNTWDYFRVAAAGLRKSVANKFQKPARIVHRRLLIQLHILRHSVDIVLNENPVILKH